MALTRLTVISIISTISLLSASLGLTPPEPPTVAADNPTQQRVAIADVEAAQTLGGELTLTECVFGTLGVSVGSLHAGALVLVVGGPVALGGGLIVAGVIVAGVMAAC